MLTIQELVPQQTNFLLRARVDDVGSLREFGGGRGIVMRTVLSDAGGLSAPTVFFQFHSSVFIASVPGISFNLVAKHVAKVLKVGQVCDFAELFPCLTSFQTYTISKCTVKPQFGGGGGIELQFNEQTAFIDDKEPITPTTSLFADIAVCIAVIAFLK